MANRNKSEEKIRYLVSRSTDEDAIIELPANWKVTFGFVNPAKSQDGYARGEGHALRAYEGEKLRLVMANVTGLRDLSIPLAKKFSKESGETTWAADSEGNFERHSKREQLEAGYTVEVVEEDPFADGEAPASE